MSVTSVGGDQITYPSSSIGMGNDPDDLGALSLDPSTMAPTPIQPAPERPKLFVRLLRRADVVLVILLIAGLIGIVVNTSTKKTANNNNASIASKYGAIEIPLDGFIAGQQGVNFGTSSVVINGPLKLNEGFVIAPSLQPSKPTSGQLYFDTNTNQLAYYNGTAFVPLGATPQIVESLGGASGQLTLGGGLTVVGNQLTVTPSGVTSLGGQVGDITLGSGLRLDGTTLQNAGITNVIAGTGIAVTNDGNGAVTIQSLSGGGTVSSGGGTSGRLSMFTGAQTIGESLVSQSGSVITITGDLNISGATTLASLDCTANVNGGVLTTNGSGQIICDDDDGGAGSSISGSGASGTIPLFNGTNSITNSIITQAGTTVTIAGDLALNTDLSVANGGTGASSFAANGIVYGNGTGPLQVTAAGTSGQVLIANGSGVPTFVSFSGDVTVAASGAATIQANSVALGTDTTGDYIQNLGALTGLNTTGNSGEGSTPTLGVVYGSGANTSVQGNTTLTCPSGTGNLTGGGTSITLGTGGTCANLNTVNNPTFTTSITTPSLILTGAGSNGTLQVANLGQTTTFILPDPAGASATICLSTGNCATAGAAGGDLTGTYPNPTIASLQGTDLDIAGPVAGHILVYNDTNDEWNNVAVSGDLAISETGVATVQANSVTLGTDTTGNYVIGLTAGNGIDITGTPGEAWSPTVAVLYGSSANTAVQGNTGITVTAGTNLTGGGSITLGAGGTVTLNVASSPTFSGTLTVQGATATFGTTSQQGSIVFHDGNGETATLSVGSALGANTTLAIPTTVGASDTVCLQTLGNCAGSGGGVTGSGNNNRLAKFTSTGSTIGDSTITDNGTTVTTTVDMVIQGGDLTVGTTSQLGSFLLHDGNGQTTTLRAGNSAGDLTFILPTNTGATNQCLKQSGTGNQLIWDDCDGGGSGTSATLQSAYDDGNLITTSNNRDIDIELADDTVDANFDLVIKDGSTGYVSFSRENGTGTADPAQFLLIDNLDASRAVPVGVKIQAAAGGITTGIDLTDTDLGAAIAVAANDIQGTTGNINFDNFDVDGSTGNITAGTYNGQTISATASFTGTVGVASTLTITAGGLTVSAGGANIAGNTTIATTAGNTLGLGNSTGAVTITGSSGSTFAINGATVDATEFNRLDGKDAALVDTNDAVNTAITGTGALGAGSITSGFGSIDTGADNITTTGTLQGTTSVLTSVLDRVSAGTLTIGNGTATQIDLGTNVSVTGSNTFTSGTGAVLLQGNTDIASTVSLATRRAATYTTAGSANDVALNVASLYLLDTSGAAQTITGITAGRDGQHLTLVNADAALAVTLSNLSASSSANNRISTGTGSDVSIPAGGSVSLVYDTANNLWRLVGGVAGGAGTCPTCANQQLSNLSSVNINTALNTTAGNLNLTTTTSGNIVLNSAGTIELQDNTNVTGTLGVSSTVTITAGGLTVSAGGASIAGNTTIATTAGNTLGLGNSTGTVTVTGSSSSTFVLNGVTVDATEFNRLEGKDAALVDTNDAVATAITGTGALNAGSITSGFGAIDTGADNITTTGTVQGTTSVLTSVLDRVTTGTLTIGNGTATQIDLGTNVTVTGANTFTSGTGTVLLQGNTDIAASASLATKRGATYTTAGSANDVALNVASLYVLDTSGAAQTITGIAAGRDGQHLTLVNADASLAVTLSNLSGSSVAANRISTGTGGDISVPAGGSITLVYDTASSLWRVVGSVAGVGGLCSSCANQQLSNLSSVNINAALNTTAGNLSLTTTTSGNIVLNSAGTIELQDATNVTGNLDVSGTIAAGTGDAFQVSTGGAVTAVGVNSGTGLIQGTGGLTVTGTVSVNNNTNSNVSINTGTSTGTVTIGGGSAVLALDTSTIDIAAGALSGVTGYAQASGNFLQSGAGTFGTGTGAVSLNGATTITGTNTLTVSAGLTSLTGNTTGDAFNVSNSTSTGNIAVFSDNATAVFTIANGGATTLSNQTNSAAAFRIQNATAADTLLAVDTTARSGSGGNLIKIGNSTGTDGDLTILQVDSTTADPTSNLAALNGGIFYNSTTHKVSLIENGQVKVICNTTDLGCGTGTVTLQSAYGNGNTITTTDNRNIEFTLADTATDSNMLFNLQCDTSCSTNGRFAVQDDGTDVFTISPAGGAVNFINFANSTQAFNVENSTGGNLFTVDTTNSRVGINLGANNTPNMNNGGLQVGGSIRMSGSSSHTFTTPNSTSINADFSIDTQQVVSGSHLITLGLSDTSDDNATGISVFDDRSSATKWPTISVWSPDEANLLGLTWANSTSEGRVTTHNKASSTAGIALQSGDSTGASATTGAVAIRSGNSTGTTGSSGAVSIDSGTANGGTTGAINIGTANTSSITLGNATNNSTISLQSGTGAISIGTGAQARTINLGTGTAVVQTINLGSTGANVIAIGNTQTGGSVSIGTAMTTGAVNVGGGVINLGSANIARTINLGTGAAQQIVNIGSTNSTSLTSIQGGAGGIDIGTDNSIAQDIDIGNGTGATAVSVSCGTGACEFGNNAVAHTTTIGSTTGAATTVLQAGTGGLSLTSGANIVLGTSNTTGTLLVLDTKTDAGDPTGVEGAMYYNGSMARMRCYFDGKWRYCNDPGSMSLGYDIREDFISGYYVNDVFGDEHFGEQGWDVFHSGIGSGIASAASEAAHPGVVQLNTGTTVNSGYSSLFLNGFNNEPVHLAGDEEIEMSVYLPTLATANTTDFNLRLGLCDNSDGTDCEDGIYFEYDLDTSANWSIVAAEGSTRTRVQSTNASCSAGGSTVAVAATTWTRLKMVVNSNATRVDYYINGTFVGCIDSGNIPVATTTQPDFTISKDSTSNGTSTSLRADYFQMRRTLTTPR